MTMWDRRLARRALWSSRYIHLANAIMVAWNGWNFFLDGKIIYVAGIFNLIAMLGLFVLHYSFCVKQYRSIAYIMERSPDVQTFTRIARHYTIFPLVFEDWLNEELKE